MEEYREDFNDLGKARENPYLIQTSTREEPFAPNKRTRSPLKNDELVQGSDLVIVRSRARNTRRSRGSRGSKGRGRGRGRSSCLFGLGRLSEGGLWSVKSKLIPK